MSNNPFSAPSQYSENASRPVPKSLPGFALFLAITGLVISGFYFLGGCCGSGGMMVLSFVSNNPEIRKQMEKEDAGAAADMDKALEQIKQQMPMIIAALAFQVFTAVVLLIGCIGILRRKEWGRKFFLGGCMVGMALIALNVVIGIVGQMSNPIAGVEDQNEKVGQIVGLVFSIVSSLLFLTYYLTSLVYFMAAERRQYFT